MVERKLCSCKLQQGEIYVTEDRATCFHERHARHDPEALKRGDDIDTAVLHFLGDMNTSAKPRTVEVCSDAYATPPAPELASEEGSTYREDVSNPL
jgi:hypothetical protein